MKKIIFILMITFVLNLSNVSAKCSYKEISRMKKLVSNVNVAYDYKITDNFAKFDLTLTNLQPDIYMYDFVNNRNYYYYETLNGEITISDYLVKSGNIKFYSANPACYGLFLGTKYYKFPTYNIYYNDPLCDGINNFSLCQKWVSNTYDYNKFKNLIYEYKKNLSEIENETIRVEYEKSLLNKIVEFYVKYYYYILVFIIVICSIIIVIDRRKNSFKL